MGFLNTVGDKVHLDPETHYFPRGLNMNGVMLFNGQNAGWVQLTQAQYDALGTKDPNTLYLIVG